MADNFDKLWMQDSLNRVAMTRAAEAIQSLGQALPCRVVSVSGSIVTVAFEVVSTQWALPQVTMPKAESQWLRAPTQVGDFGMTVPADAYLGGISGLGGGTATLKRRGNLSTLVFVPVASTAFEATPDLNKAWVNGPAGAVLSNAAQTSGITVSDASVVITVGGLTWTFSAAGFAFSTGVIAETHVHTGGSGSMTPTGIPIP